MAINAWILQFAKVLLTFRYDLLGHLASTLKRYRFRSLRYMFFNGPALPTCSSLLAHIAKLLQGKDPSDLRTAAHEWLVGNMTLGHEHTRSKFVCLCFNAEATAGAGIGRTKMVLVTKQARFSWRCDVPQIHKVAQFVRNGKTVAIFTNPGLNNLVS